MDSKTTLDAIEGALDVIEDQLDGIEEVGAVVGQNKTVVLIVAGISVVLASAASAFAGYKVADKRLKDRYAALSASEIAEAKVYYAKLNKEGDFATPEQAAEALLPAGVVVEPEPEDKLVTDAIASLQNYKGERVAYDKIEKGEPTVVQKREGTPPVVEETVEITKNVFRTSTIPAEWNYDDEVAKRTAAIPYIITEDEFAANESGYEQENWTYFAGDDVLEDERGSIVPNKDETVGEDNLLRFGHGSSNPNVVCVRNELLSKEYEIAQSDGMYSKEVMGLKDDELQHSYEPMRGPKGRRRGEDG